ncbi:MAG TPA: ATP-dependent DNA ligase, partial [Bryobacteraceae bacterium]|nr:ATP-dependent DNA ligase [Bryobacteraceae bacterium]
MLLSTVVETSRRVAETTKRREKSEALAALLRQLMPDEIAVVVPYLAGGTRQGRVGIGYAMIRDAMAPPAPEATLQVTEVDRMLDAYADVQGAGSAARRREIVQAVFARATEAEQQFLTGLLMGELRQGALEGIMVEAVAKASGASVARVRQAVMMAGDIAPVARAAMERGEAGLSQYDL